MPQFLKNYLELDQTEKELDEFHILTAESAFIVRTFFFLFFGFSIQLSNFESMQPLYFGVLIILIMLLLRYAYFTITTFKVKPRPLVYISPRGLISILLFIQLKEVEFIDLSNSLINERVLLIVILSSMLFMLIGTLKKPRTDYPKDGIDDETPLTFEMDVDPSDIPENNSENTLN